MNNTRKLLITAKHHRHDVMLLEVILELRKHQSVYQISFLSPALTPNRPTASQANLSSSFVSHLVNQQSTAGIGARDCEWGCGSYVTVGVRLECY